MSNIQNNESFSSEINLCAWQAQVEFKYLRQEETNHTIYDVDKAEQMTNTKEEYACYSHFFTGKNKGNA